MTTYRDRPAYRLTRHFFSGHFDLGFLSEAGTDSFKRLILGIAAAFFSFGLLLVRVFMAKYASLAALDSPEPYRQALVADHAFLMAVPMWNVAFVAVLTGHSLFPDETDFRVLMTLPLTRRMVFAAKLLALILFTGLFIAAAHLALAPLFLLTSLGPAEHAFLLRAAAYVTASLLASGFAVLLVTAVHGVLLLAAPHGRLLATSTALRSLMLCALVLSVPLLMRLPGQAAGFAEGASWLYLTPPAWFVGLERWLLGDRQPHVIRLAEIAATGLAVALGLAAGSYAVLYRHFDRVMLRPSAGPEHSRRRFVGPWRRRDVSRPAFVAVRTFTSITFRRSVLHQGILIALSAAAAGLVLNSFIAAGMLGWLRHGDVESPRLIRSVIWAPFALIFAVSLAVRAALAVPIEPRANWVFRVTEQDAARPDQLAAAAHAVSRLGLIAPVMLLFPLQWRLLGWNAIGVSIVAMVCGWLFVEILMKDWERIPFTCSYIPGKGFVPQTILIGFLSFVLFTTLGSALAWFSLAGLWPALVFDAMILAIAWGLRRRRLTMWRYVPLAFEDSLPTEVNPLRLMVD